MNISFPNEGIYTLGKKEASYANSVLISLANIDCIYNWFNQINSYNINNNSLTKKFCQLLVYFYTQQQAESTSIIKFWEEEIKKAEEAKPNPYYFLHYFLKTIHIEINNLFNPKFDEKIYKSQAIKNINNQNSNWQLFKYYYDQTQNSFISQYFFNLEENIVFCDNCKNLYLFTYRDIFIFDIDKYKGLKNGKNINLNLEDCFQYYSFKYQCECTCKNKKALEQKIIYNTAKVLILNFERKKHKFKGDINFNKKIIQFNQNYILKACISIYSNEKYISDLNINGLWYRYKDNKKINIMDKEIYDYEPIMLIYELESIQINNNLEISNPYLNNPFNYMNQMMINNGFYNIPYQQMLIPQQQICQVNLMKQNFNNFQQKDNCNQENDKINDNLNINNLNNENSNKNNIICQNDLNTNNAKVNLDNNLNNNVYNAYNKFEKNLNKNNAKVIIDNKLLNNYDSTIILDNNYLKNTNDNSNLENNLNNINSNPKNNLNNNRINSNNNVNLDKNLNNNKTNQKLNDLKVIVNFCIIPKNLENLNLNDTQLIEININIESSVKMAIDSFFAQYKKERKDILEFQFNDNIINANSQESLRDIGIKNESKIYAIKNEGNMLVSKLKEKFKDLIKKIKNKK